MQNLVARETAHPTSWVGAGLGPPKGSVFGGLHVLLLKF